MEYTEREQVIISIFKERLDKLEEEVLRLKLEIKLEKIRKKKLEYLKSIQ